MITSRFQNSKKIRTSEKRIMIVDDNPYLRIMIQKMLEPEGFTTMQVKDGESFLKNIDKFDPQIVILDVLMPGLTTVQIIAGLQGKKSRPCIILLTVVRYSKKTLDDMFKNGAISAYITKPFDLDMLLNTINELYELKIFHNPK
jgi:DNA-binding response OmpR family regulator